MLTAAKGFRLKRPNFNRYASDAVDHGRVYAYRDRRTKKRNYRYLWQIRINAAVRELGLTYSRFMEGLKAAKVGLDRKVLADIAAQDTAAFTELVNIARPRSKTSPPPPWPRPDLKNQKSRDGGQPWSPVLLFVVAGVPACRRARAWWPYASTRRKKPSTNLRRIFPRRRERFPLSLEERAGVRTGIQLTFL